MSWELQRPSERMVSVSTRERRGIGTQPLATSVLRIGPEPVSWALSGSLRAGEANHVPGGLDGLGLGARAAADVREQEWDWVA